MQETVYFKVARLHRLSGENSIVKAFADISVNDAVLIRGLRVVEGKKGLFVSMPQEQGKDKRWYDTIRCLTKDAKFSMSKAVLAAYGSDA